MRIVFIGTVEFSLKCLSRLIDMKTDVVAVVTKESSSFNADHADIIPICLHHNIPYKTVNDINHPNNIAWIRSFSPDVIFCFGWSSLLKHELLNLAPKGVIGYHPAALPDNRGRHPLIWALALGLESTASTFFIMDEGADTGDIISQEKIIITENDNAADLYEKMTTTALRQIEAFVPALANNSVNPVPQKKEGNNWRKRGRKDGEIDFRMHSDTIFNLVRALSKPYPGAHIVTNGEDVKVWKVKKEHYAAKNIEPGKVLAVNNNNILVKTADTAIWLVEHEFNELPALNSYL